MSGKVGDMLVILASLIVVGVSSEPVQQEYSDDSIREERQLPEDSYNGPVDLHDQLQSLTYVNTEETADDGPPHNSWSALVPGTPGTDYPNLNKIPETSFSCGDKTPGGYYADMETGCQVFHICNIGGSKSSFLCPEGSIFNQRHFVCDWWYGFHCEEAESLYPENNPESNETNDTESIDSPVSESIDNYGSINFRNDSPKDLTLARSGEGGSLERLPKDNQREPLSDEQRNMAHHNEKLDRKLRGNYRNEEKFRQYRLINSENARENLDLGDDRGEEGRMRDREFSGNTDGQDFQDTTPRGFSFNRPTRRISYPRSSQIPRASPNFQVEGILFNSTDEEIRYVPAL
ncbi:uncharacterized protein [Fopius arisanus]|uniref:Chitin-binding type-2 domain-containing protein n=1 Tax=Fopius arisanus TaxID=64838 RepID=A0A9R1SZE6_9HYME|nr:PREDICTED: uncharacterized protein LOC105264579 [Fopius arisanus]